ncbi:MAG: response regulator [Chloroflexi bacterium]|nr:response regulator [Chloroflexota bacterium]
MTLVLIVDDDPLTLSLLTQAVEILGQEAITANSGEEAIKSATEHDPDLILLDLNLGDMDGINVLKKVRSRKKTADIPIIILTAGVGINTAELVKEVAPQAFLIKPARLQTLLELIQKHSGDD